MAQAKKKAARPRDYSIERLDDRHGTIEIHRRTDGKVRRIVWDHDGTLLDRTTWLDPSSELGRKAGRF